MALADENMVMPVAPVNGNGMDGNGWWIVLLLLLFAGGGFGANGSNNLYPWLNQADITTNGFQNAGINSAISSLQNNVTSGFGDIQNALCAGFAGVTNGFSQAEIAENARQMATMNQINGIQSQLAQCCCDNRLATVQTQNIVQSEGAATRLAIQNQTQQILDKLCQQEIEAKNDRIAELERQLNFANLNASQTAQTQYIIDALKTTSTT